MPKSKTQFSDALRKQRNPPQGKQKVKRKKGNTTSISGNRQNTAAFVPRPAKILRVTSPRVKQMRNGNFRISHREFVGTLVSVAISSNTWAVFNIQQTPNTPAVPARFRINPASEGTFGWLSPIGKCFERFKFHKCKIILLPKTNFQISGDNIITPDYDAEDGAPFSEIIATNNINSVSGPIMQTLVCDLPPSKLNRAYQSHYCMGDVRFANTSQDTKTIDPAQVIFSGENGIGTGSGFAKIWIEYDVEFDTPQSATEAANQSGMVTAQSTSGSGFSGSIFQAVQSNPIATSLNNNANTNLLQFNRDWVGDLTSVFQSTGALNPASYVPLRNGQPFPAANTGPGSFTYGPTTSTAVGAGGGSSFRIDPVSFKTGDILSYTATLPSVATLLNTYMGGSSAGYIPQII